MKVVPRLLACASALLVACSSVGDAVVDVSAPLTQPESALHDPVADVYLISNVVGAPAAKDNNGYITMLDPNGAVRAPRFIAGGQSGVELDAPKGMAIVGETLVVADIDKVRRFDRRSGMPQGSVAVEDAEFLNDVLAWDNGSVLVSDMGTNRILLVDAAGAVSTWAQNAAFGGSNGLARAGDEVWVVGYASGTVSRLSKAGKVLAQHRGPGELDGAVAQGKNLLVSSWADKAVLRMTEGGEFEKVLRKLESPADIGFDEKRQRLLVPMMMASRFLVFDLKP